MYLWARSWGIQPSEFWNMTVSEWWAEYDNHAPATKGDKYAGKLTQGDVEDLLEWTRSGKKKNGNP